MCFRSDVTVQPAELRCGVLRVAESPTPRHQSAVVRIFRALDGYVGARGIGEVWLAPLDVILDEERALIVQPDLMFISRECADRPRSGARPHPEPRTLNTER